MLIHNPRHVPIVIEVNHGISGEVLSPATARPTLMLVGVVMGARGVVMVGRAVGNMGRRTFLRGVIQAGRG